MWRRGPNDGREVRCIRSSGRSILHLEVGDTPRPFPPSEREIIVEWGAGRLECNYLLDEVGASIADSPAVRSSLAVGEEVNRLVQIIDKCRVRRCVIGLGNQSVSLELDLGSVERVEHRIADTSSARPLSMQTCLRPKIEVL